MSSSDLPAPDPSDGVLHRSRALRRESRQALDRSARLRLRGSELCAVPGHLQLRLEMVLSRAREARALREQRRLAHLQAREDADVVAWYRARVMEMLAGGWSRAELADVGVTEALLRELDLPVPE